MKRAVKVELEGGRVAAAGERAYRCRFIRAGQVRAAGNRPGRLEITPQALREAARQGLFDGRAVFLDHAGPAYPSLRNLVGVTGGAAWTPAGGSVEGVITLYDTPAGETARRLLDGLLAQGEQAPDVGLSLVFWPAAAELERGRIESIGHVESVDLVFEPAAGGRVLARMDASAETQDSTGGANMTEEEKLNSEQPNDATQPAEHWPDDGHAFMAAIPPDWPAAVAAAAAPTLLAASGLPAASRERLAGVRFASTDALRQAIEDERQYLAALSQDSVVQIGGTAPRSPHISLGFSPVEQVGHALHALLAGTRPPGGVAPLTGIREAYVTLSGDYEMSGMFHPERVALANVNSSTMAGLVADALNKRLANLFQEYPHWWEPITVQEDFHSLQAVQWVTLGGIGDLPTVAEGAAYSELTWDDMNESAAFVKKGGYLGLTLEAIDKDDTRRLQAAPRALAQAAWLSLSKAVSAIFTGSGGAGPTMSDGKALFHNDHGNLGSAALSIASYTAARAAMRKQAELNSGERLGSLTAPRFLLVPPDLEITALQVLASPFDYSYALANAPAAPDNPHAEGDGRIARREAASRRVIVVDLWSDADNWAAVADPHLYPTIGIGYRYGRTPEVFSVASPTAGLMFSNDTLPVKVRFFFAAGPMDWRGVYKANVA